jgi:tetratricopeptide (TPR) repeat protein
MVPTSDDAALPAGLPAQVELTQVPFYPQDAYQCGPATLAMALTFAGAERTANQLERQVYLPKRQGSLQPEMLAATRRAGLIAYPLQADLGALLRELAAGHPVIVLQNLGWDFFPQWHYALVVGYERLNAKVAISLVLRSGTQERLLVDRAQFEHSWARAGRWAFVAVPPGQTPATASEDGFVAAAADLERAVPDAARVAYDTALDRWPGNLVARIGLGNIAYGAQRLDEAERQFRQATLEHADSGDAWNNLAQVLHETGRDGEAAAAAERAVALGGERESIYRATLQAIVAAPPR